MNLRFLSMPVAVCLVSISARADEKFSPEMAEFVKRFTGRGALGDKSPRPSPAEALAQFKVADGLALRVAASEPMVRQPLNMNFDERGRLCVVQNPSIRSRLG